MLIQKCEGNIYARFYALSLFHRNDKRAIETLTTSVWLGCLACEDSKREDDVFFQNVPELLERLRNLAHENASRNTSEHPKSVCIYTFDLAFAWSFILPYMGNMKLKQDARLDYDSENSFNAYLDEYASKCWSVEIKFAREDGLIVLKDISRMFPGEKSLKDLSAKLGVMRNFLTIDEEKDRPIFYDPTEQEKDSIYSSTMAICDILGKMRGDDNFFRSFSIANYSFKRLLSRVFGWCPSPYNVFRCARMFPYLGDELNATMQGAVYGGWVGVITKHKEEEIEDVISIDKRQLYPYLQCRYAMPCGKPERFDGYKDEFSKECLYRVRVLSYDYARLNFVQELNKRAAAFLCEPLDFDIWLWDFELNILPKCYEGIEYEVLETYVFKTRNGIFAPYYTENYEKRTQAEKDGDLYLYNFYKLLNNAAIGKTAQKTKEEDFEARLNERGDLIVKRKKREKKKIPTYAYPPLNACTTARGRWLMARLALKAGFENVLYVDTDCLFLKRNEKTEEFLKTIDPSETLNGWHITRIKKASFFMSKRYKYETEDGEIVAKASGITLNSGGVACYDGELEEGREYQMKVRQKAKGGTIYAPLTKKIGG